MPNKVLAKALGKNVPVKYTGRGAGHLKQYMLIEVDTLELKNIKVNTDAFVGIHSLLYSMMTLMNVMPYVDGGLYIA
jgi:hypothetical protein